MKEALYGIAAIVLGALSICYTLVFMAAPVAVCLAAIKYLSN